MREVQRRVTPGVGRSSLQHQAECDQCFGEFSGGDLEKPFGEGGVELGPKG